MNVDTVAGTLFKVFGRREVIDNKIPLAMTMGNFDGVHIGHQRLLADFLAFSQPLPSCVLTFFPHPTRLFVPDAPKPMILNIQERVERLLALGVDAVVVQNFTEDFAEYSADEYLQVYLANNFNIKKIMIGYDFSYGKDRRGTWDHLQMRAPDFGWEIQRGRAHCWGDEIVSSSRIRELIVKGRVDEAELLLGYPYTLFGEVIHGDKRGRVIGFPTANIDAQNEIIPAYGVYACEVFRHSRQTVHRAVMNCGYRPTLGQDLRLQIEAHLLNFDEDLYGEKLSFRLRKFIRKERKFGGLGELKEQIQSDIEAADRFFGVDVND